MLFKVLFYDRDNRFRAKNISQVGSLRRVRGKSNLAPEARPLGQIHTEQGMRATKTKQNPKCPICGTYKQSSPERETYFALLRI